MSKYLWKNAVHPTTCRINAKEHWGCSGGSSRPNILLSPLCIFVLIQYVYAQVEIHRNESKHLTLLPVFLPLLLSNSLILSSQHESIVSLPVVGIRMSSLESGIWGHEGKRERERETEYRSNVIYLVLDSQPVNYTYWRGSGGHRGEGHNCINTDTAVLHMIGVWRTQELGDGSCCLTLCLPTFFFFSFLYILSHLSISWFRTC